MMENVHSQLYLYCEHMVPKRKRFHKMIVENKGKIILQFDSIRAPVIRAEKHVYNIFRRKQKFLFTDSTKK
mgnify:FL=1